MPALTIKGVADEVYRRLKTSAARHRRSLNSEVITCLERSLAFPEPKAGRDRGGAGATSPQLAECPEADGCLPAPSEDHAPPMIVVGAHVVAYRDPCFHAKRSLRVRLRVRRTGGSPRGAARDGRRAARSTLPRRGRRPRALRRARRGLRRPACSKPMVQTHVGREAGQPGPGGRSVERFSAPVVTPSGRGDGSTSEHASGGPFPPGRRGPGSAGASRAGLS